MTDTPHDLPAPLREALHSGTIKNDDVLHIPAKAHAPGVAWGEALRWLRVSFHIELASPRSLKPKTSGLVRATIYAPSADRSVLEKHGVFEGTQAEFRERIIAEEAAAHGGAHGG